jgi:hypothetical protein
LRRVVQFVKTAKKNDWEGIAGFGEKVTQFKKQLREIDSQLAKHQSIVKT